METTTTTTTTRSSSDHQESISSKQKNGNNNYALLIANFVFLFAGSVSSCLLSKYYFVHKGSSIWVSTWVQSAGFPLLFLPIFVPYHILRTTERKPFTRFTKRLVSLSVLVGLLLGVNNLLFSVGNSYLPVSTSSLLLSSQLAFTLVLSVAIVGQRVTFSNLNCVVLLVTSSLLLALGSSHDKPGGLTRSKYFTGFASTLGAGLLFSLYLPVMERVYRHVYCYAMAVEMQAVMEASATALATVGMTAGRGFRDMRIESSEVFDVGPRGYWAAVVGNLVTWQLCFMGTAGMVFATTSLTGGICMTALMAVNVVGGVVVYGDAFGGVKAVSTVLSVWGFCSYVYGMYVSQVKDNNDRDRQDRDNDDHHRQFGGGTEMVAVATGNDRV